VAVATALLAGCDLIPGTDANLEKRAKDRAAQLLIDPSSAQFRNVDAREGVVCGEINGKNRMGAYAGFSRFYVDVGTWSAAIDPQFDFDDLDSARSLCSSIGGSSCTRAAEEENKRFGQVAFDTFWNGKCEAKGPTSRAPFDPTLPSQGEENWIEEGIGENKVDAASDADSETWFEAPESDKADESGDGDASPPPPESRNATTDEEDRLDQDFIDRATGGNRSQ
jgi:hypothetical protein